MKAIRLTWAVAIAASAIVAGGQRATAQEASGQYYGYPSPQGAVASGQGQYGGGHSGYGCHAEKWGCHVEVCPPPSCHNVDLRIPGLEIPSCQNPYVIVSEAPPYAPQTVTIYRNHYVPIKIVSKPTPVQPVNILVKWREVHYLCDCAPGSSQCPHIPTGSPQSFGSPQASNGAAAKDAPAAEVVQASTKPAETVAVATAPAAAEAAPASTPAKRWVWLRNQGAYGYGYQRADGFWVIDSGSMRPTLPAEGTNTASQPATDAAATR